MALGRSVQHDRAPVSMGAAEGAEPDSLQSIRMTFERFDPKPS
jgi:hypothetical protein